MSLLAYQWLTWLADALRAEGCTVVEGSGWKSRGRPSSSGSFAPYGVLWHHTGTTSSPSNPAPTLSMCIDGRPDLPGPLCHVLIGYDGVCHLVAAGRANHAGKNGGSGPIPAGDGNAQLVGFEIDYNGTQAMSQEQYDAATRASCACLKRFNRSADYTRRHQETSTTGKWDAGGVTGTQIRTSVASALAGSAAPSGDDDWLAEPKDVWAVKWGGSDKTAMNFIDTLDDQAADKTWTRKPWNSDDPASAAVALQRIYGWCQQMQADITAIKSQLE